MLKKLLSLLILCTSVSLSAEQTLSIIKPDAVKKHHIGEIISVFEQNGLTIANLKLTQLNKKEAQDFYAEHKGRPFYDSLVDFMTSGPVVVMVLDGDNAIAKNRELMGATDPSAAADGTLRKKFGANKGENAVHGSDSPEAAKREINFFFSK